MKQDYFEGLIGQAKAKQELGFYLDNHHNSGAILPHLLFTGQKGDGKTMLAKKVARNMPDPENPDKKHKAFYNINGSSIENLRTFLEDYVTKAQGASQYFTFFIDEAHDLPKKVQTALLTILEPNKMRVNRFVFQDIEYTFDFHKITFIFATTDEDKLDPALKDRLVNISLKQYDRKELAEIIKLVVDGACEFEGGVLEDLAIYVRRNGRAADRMATNILALGCPIFKKAHSKKLKDKLGMLPYGLEEIEMDTLRTLDDCGELSLGQLASRIGRPAKTTQKGVEPYLLALGLMEIDGKRRISAKGRELRQQIDGKANSKKRLAEQQLS